jgi:hypothetical protein
MPRHPTGRPVGRPRGTSKLGTVKRVTVHLPDALYARLEAYAEGRRFARGGSPQLPTCVREAIEHYLICPQKRQTQPQEARAQTEVAEIPAPQNPPRRRKRQAAPAA